MFGWAGGWEIVLQGQNTIGMWCQKKVGTVRVASFRRIYLTLSCWVESSSMIYLLGDFVKVKVVTLRLTSFPS